MKIPLKAKVICKDGEYGSVKELLIDPVKEKVTHLVIENKHNGTLIVIPKEIMDYTTDSVVTIDKTAKEIDSYPKFLIHEFIKVPASDTEFAYWGADPTMTHSYTMFPYVIHNGNPVIEVTKEDVPKGEMKLKRGMSVKDLDGKKLGNIDELIIDPVTGFITHLVMRQGHLYGSRDIAVPNMDIYSFDKECVVLSIKQDEIQNMPEVIIKRAWK
ncbi:MAG: hypothetical protein JXR64_00970 [Spirochaetales bacterium]|nr:hypothetical protein [Spirochaetales bacterium]